MPFREILVPTDFSDSSRSALRLAIKLAKATQARVTVLHVGVVPHFYATELGMAGPAGPLFTQMAEEVNREQRRRLQELCAEEIPEDVPSVQVIRDGFAPEEVKAQVADGGHDLVVMGTHGRTGLQRALLGSVTERVVRECPVPVMSTH